MFSTPPAPTEASNLIMPPFSYDLHDFSYILLVSNPLLIYKICAIIRLEGGIYL